MIKFEHVVLPSPEQMEFIIEGMRNPLESWGKSDSYITKIVDSETLEEKPFEFFMGDDDSKLALGLSIFGTDHRKFIRMIPVMVRITAPLYWWKEFDTYKIGTVANSCSTMHKLHCRDLTLDDFSHEHLIRYCQNSVEVLENTIQCINLYRNLYIDTKNKVYWWQMIQLLPSSYNQTRNVVLNYEVLANIYKGRNKHKLDEWRAMCQWIETLPWSFIITENTSGGQQID